MNFTDFEQIKSSDIAWNKFLGKTILITGGNGFLPAYMVETLLLLNKSILGHNPVKVFLVVRNKKHTEERFKDFVDDKNLNILIQDVSNEIKISQNIDFIIHAASPASPKYFNIDPLGVSLPNILGTKNTLSLAVKNNIDGYLYFSSGEVYGETKKGEMISENSYGYLDPISIRSCYGESKRMGENLCISYGHKYNIPIKIVRPFHTYGPGMKLDDGRVFADFVRNIVMDENIEMKSDGNAVRSFCYISDATIAFFKILLEGKNNNAYNMSNPTQSVSIKELAEILIDLFPEKKLKVIYKNQSQDYLKSPIEGHIANISKLQSLDWNPSVSISEGFTKTIRSYL